MGRGRRRVCSGVVAASLSVACSDVPNDETRSAARTQTLFAADEVHACLPADSSPQQFDGRWMFPICDGAFSRPRSSRILVHEWIHAEMGKHAHYELLPTWFNEGVATFFADEPQCGHVASRSVSSLRDVDTKPKWQQHLQATDHVLETYCQSSREIARWLAAFPTRAGAAAAVRIVLHAVVRGAEFGQVYGPIRTDALPE